MKEYNERLIDYIIDRSKNEKDPEFDDFADVAGPVVDGRIGEGHERRPGVEEFGGPGGRGDFARGDDGKQTEGLFLDAGDEFGADHHAVDAAAQHIGGDFIEFGGGKVVRQLEYDGFVGVVVAAELQQMVDDLRHGGPLRDIEDEDVDEVVEQGEGLDQIGRGTEVAQDDHVVGALLQIAAGFAGVVDGADFNEGRGVTGHDFREFAPLVDTGRHADGMDEVQTHQTLSQSGRLAQIERADDRMEEGRVFEDAEKWRRFGDRHGQPYSS